MDLDIVQMRSFITVLDTGSLTRAAEQLNCTQGTMSVRIQAFEKILNIQLFKRQGRSVAPTPAAQEIAPQIRTILRQHDAFTARLNRDPIPSISVGIAEDYTTPRLVQNLNALRTKHAILNLNLVCRLSSILIPMMEDNGLDAVIVTPPNRQEIGKILSTPMLKWVCAPGFEYTPNAPVPLSLYEGECAFKNAMTSVLEQANIPWAAAGISASSRGVMSIVEAGLGVCAMANNTIPEHLTTFRFDGLPPLPNTELRLIISNRTPNISQTLEEVITEAYIRA